MSDQFNDDHSGRGGSYVIDKDGKRQLVRRQEKQPAKSSPAAKNVKQPKKQEGSE